MGNDVGLRVRLEKTLRDEFVAACHANDRQAAGTCWFLVAACEHLRDKDVGFFRYEKARTHIQSCMFCEVDFDPTMLLIANMDMTHHGVDNPDVSYRKSLVRAAVNVRLFQ